MLGRIRLQRLMIAGLLFAIALVVIRILAIQGWYSPARIVSGSMAERYRGEHYAVRCWDCGFVFYFGTESPPFDDRPVCPNCGYDRNVTQREERARGQRVLIDRGAYWFSEPQRFEVVAFRDTKQPWRLLVKRVAGLPGEKIGIRQGELFANGQLVRKSLAQFRLMAITVHDNRYLPEKSPGMRPRWRPNEDGSGWKLDGSTLRFTPRHSDSDDFDWVSYHHWRCYPSPYPRTAEAPIADHSGYNQAESRALQTVSDIVLRARVLPEGSGEFAIRVHDGREWFYARISLPQKSIQVDQSDKSIATANFPSEQEGPAFEIEFGIVDRQVVLAIDREEVIRQAYEPASEWEPLAQPMEIGGRSLKMDVSELVIRRDVYYLDPTNLGQPWERKQALAEGEYFLLGDNPSLSEDSRHAAVSTVQATQILGRVLPLPW